MRRSLVTFAFLTVAMVQVLTACGRKYRLQPDNIGEERSWACSRGSAAQTGYCDSPAFEDRLDLIWTQGNSGKPAGPLSIHNGALIYPDTRKKVHFYDVETGRHLGRLKAKGVAQTGVAVADSLAFWGVAPRRDGFFGYNLNTSRRQWEKKVKDAFSGPILLGNRLVVSSGEGGLLALELDRGEPAWTFQADQRLTASASFGYSRIFQPADQGWLYAISAESGQELYRIRLDGPLVSAVAVADRVYVAVMTGQVYALESDDGSVVWKTDLGHPIWTSPAVANGRVFVGHSGGEVVALEASTGLVLWRYNAGAVIRSSALAVGDRVVTGTMTGLLVVLKAKDGVLIDSTTLKGPIKVSPVTDGRRLLVATEAGKIYCFGDSDEQADLAHKRVNPQLQSQ